MRRKDPDGVRRSLLAQASAIASGQGLTDVTVAAVASAAGVTKGGLFHHFATRRALVEAMFDDLMESLDERIDALLAVDPERYGRFTRAYLRAATSMGEDDRRMWGALASALTPGSRACRLWYAWLDARLDLHADTDADSDLEIVRLAADGAWLVAITRATAFDIDRLRGRLESMTTGGTALR